MFLVVMFLLLLLLLFLYNCVVHRLTLFFRSVIVLVICLIINFRFKASHFRSFCDVADLELRFSISIARALS